MTSKLLRQSAGKNIKLSLHFVGVLEDSLLVFQGIFILFSTSVSVLF